MWLERGLIGGRQVFPGTSKLRVTALPFVYPQRVQHKPLVCKRNRWLSRLSAQSSAEFTRGRDVRGTTAPEYGRAASGVPLDH